MKTLVLDLGNSTLFAGVFRDDKLLRTARIDVGRDRPPSPRLWRAGLTLQLQKLARGKVDRVALCSVVPKQTETLVRLVRKIFGIEPTVLTPSADHGLKIAYRRPDELGADRLATVLGARKLYPNKHIIVVDCGTATTITLLDREGVLLGGAIMPGLGLWPTMLAQRTARLPEVKLRPPDRVVARDTAGALRSGILIGHAGAIRELVTKSREEAFARAPVVVLGTGGLVTHFKGERLFTALAPDLILRGLQAFAAQNSHHA